MEGKKKKRGGILIAKPDYKKAYITLRTPLSMSQDLYPIRVIEEERRNMTKESKSNSKSKSSIVEEEGEVRSHWLNNEDRGMFRTEKSSGGGGRRGGNYRGGEGAGSGTAKFPWSSMRSPSR